MRHRLTQLMHPALPSKNARVTFWVLLIALIAIELALLLVVTLYWRIEPQPTPPARLALETNRIVTIAKLMPLNQLKKTLPLLNRSGLLVTLQTKPEDTALQLPQPDPKTLEQMALSSPNFHITIPLEQHAWLSIRHVQPTLPLAWQAGFALVASLLLIGLIALAYWAIKRVTLPVDSLTKAVQRFSRDVQAPPLAESGPAELRQLSKAFNLMQQQIRKLLQDRMQMLAAISHDLRTPLTRLQLRAEYLQGSPHYHKALHDIQEMEHMITSILFFARNDSNHGIKQSFDLSALLTTVCHDWQDSGRPVTCNELSARVTYYGNMTTLKRAFNNLIDNAIKYGKTANITLANEQDTTKITIADQGPGIAPAELDKVFNPFYRIDPARSPQQSGAGLGLAIARDIITAHGGDINLYNASTGGLQVVVTLTAVPY